MTIYDKVVKLLPEQYKSAENLNKVLSIFGDEVDELLTAIAQVKASLYINSAVGIQLDLIGVIIDLKRNALTDETYREEIIFKIFQNVSIARVEDLIFILKTVTQATLIVYSDDPPAAYTIYTDGSTINGNLNDFMDKVSGGGISVSVYMGLEETPLVFPLLHTTEADLIDNNDNNIVTNIGLQIIVNFREGGISQDLLDLYSGDGMGTVAINSLTDDIGNNIVINTGQQIIMVDRDGVSTDPGGKLPITFE